MKLFAIVLHYSDNTVGYYYDLFRTEYRAKRIAEEYKSDDPEVVSYEIVDFNFGAE